MAPADIPSPLSLLLELGQAFHSTLELDPLLVSILRHMQSAAQSEDVSVWLLDPLRARLNCTHAVGPQADRFIGRSLPAAAWLHRPDPAWVAPGDGAPPGAADMFWGEAGSVILAHLEARGELLGALCVANRRGQAGFSEADRALVTALAGHAAVAILNAQLYAQQRRSNDRQHLLEQISRHLQQTLDSAVLIPLILRSQRR